MNTAYESFLPLLLTLLKASLVVGIALITTLALTRAHAASRHAVWATSLVVVLLLPLFSQIDKEIPIPVGILERSPAAVAVAPNPAPAGREQATRTPAFLIKQESKRSVPWAAIGWSLYAAGILIVLVPFVTGITRARRIAGRARAINRHDAWRSALADVGRPPRFSSVDLLVSSEIEMPITFGVFHPIVLLPDSASSWPPGQRHDALVHEFAHVQRFDWGAQCVSVLARAVHWFNPLVWMAGQRLQLEAERACDERVVRLGASPHDYAEQLISLTRDRRNTGLPATLAMARESFLAGRVRTLLDPTGGTRHSRPILTAAAVLLTAGSLALAPLQPVAAGGHDRSARHRGNPSDLMIAAREGDISEVRALIAGGANVDERRRGQGTPLILAATYGELGIAEALIAAGAEVNRSETGTPRNLMRTPLTAAAENGSREIVELLLDAGARIDAAPDGDGTALMEAAKNRHEAVVSLLLERAADVRLKVDGDGNALIAAAEGGSVRIARMILQAGADVNAGVPGDGNPLIVAVNHGDLEMVGYLISEGADPTAYVPGDETALQAAAGRGDTKLLRLLLDATE